MGARFGLRAKARSGMLWILRGAQLLSKQEAMIEPAPIQIASAAYVG